MNEVVERVESLREQVACLEISDPHMRLWRLQLIMDIDDHLYRLQLAGVK